MENLSVYVVAVALDVGSDGSPYLFASCICLPSIELDELEELMKKAGWPTDVRANILKMVTMNNRSYDKWWRAAGVDAKTNRTSWPGALPDHPGTITLGGDPDGHPVGISRRQLNDHMLVVGRRRDAGVMGGAVLAPAAA